MQFFWSKCCKNGIPDRRFIKMINKPKPFERNEYTNYKLYVVLPGAFEDQRGQKGSSEATATVCNREHSDSLLGKVLTQNNKRSNETN